MTLTDILFTISLLGYIVTYESLPALLIEILPHMLDTPSDGLVEFGAVNDRSEQCGSE